MRFCCSGLGLFIIGIGLFLFLFCRIEISLGLFLLLLGFLLRQICRRILDKDSPILKILVMPYILICFVNL